MLYSFACTAGRWKQRTRGKQDKDEETVEEHLKRMKEACAMQELDNACMIRQTHTTVIFRRTGLDICPTKVAWVGVLGRDRPSLALQTCQQLARPLDQ